MRRRKIQAGLNGILFLAYLLCVFSVGMYEAEIITFKQCMQDFGVYMAFGCISLISKVLVRNI